MQNLRGGQEYQLGNLDLYRQQLLMGMGPFGAPGGAFPGASTQPGAGASSGGNRGAPQDQPTDPTQQGGQAESTFMMGPNGYGSSQLPAPPAQGTPQSQPQSGASIGVGGNGGASGSAGG